MQILSRIPQPACRAVALETTLLVHGVPRESASRLGADLAQIVRNEGAYPALVGVHAGVPTVGLSDQELTALLEAKEVPKANTANLGVLLHQSSHAATTVSTTMELAAPAGIRLFATGGIGGVHRGYGTKLDISSDLAAFARHPVAVVTSGVKSILDVEATRELLETLGVPVIGYRTSSFPAFYLRTSKAEVDARFDDPEQLASFVRAELARTGRGIVIANPVPHDHELDAKEWEEWLDLANKAAAAEVGRGRSATPLLLSKLHEVSGDRTLRSNIELAKSNAALAGRIAAVIAATEATR
ncbi:MAG: pseudouridine-5'-phosphate glycosidase [Phycisphaeraceae bacterium]|nr:pseudouridine-5'-phosphate glycosidase [Phycisphaeraceae bacterium]